jgi:hypothetical protein
MNFLGQKLKKTNKTQKKQKKTRPGWFFFKSGFLPTLA